MDLSGLPALLRRGTLAIFESRRVSFSRSLSSLRTSRSALLGEAALRSTRGVEGPEGRELRRPVTALEAPPGHGPPHPPRRGRRRRSDTRGLPSCGEGSDDPWRGVADARLEDGAAAGTLGGAGEGGDGSGPVASGNALQRDSVEV